MKSDELVSIIIPIFNAEKYLKRCVESILNSTYKELEIILVDDGSRDSSPDICDSYAERDKRVYVIHKENEGVAMARVTGIAKASGGYIMFVDADDYITEVIIEHALSVLMKNGADIVCFDYLINNHQKGFSISEEECMNKKEAIKNMLLRKKLDGNLWCKIYKANLVKCPNVQMRNQKHCDFLTMGMILENAEKICMLPECGYVYSIIEGSATHSNAFNPRQEEYIWGAEEYHAIISRKYPDIKFASEYNLLMALLFVEIKMQKDKDINRKDSRYIMIHSKLKTNIGRYVRSPYISRRDKIQAILIYVGVFSLLWKVYCRV